MFCVRGFGGGVGVSLFFGGLFWLVRRVFSGFWGFLCFSFVLLLLVGVGGGLRGVPGFGVRRARVSCFLLVGGRVWGASARAWFLSCPVLAVVGSGGRGRVCVLPGSRGGGRVVPGFFCCLLWWGFSGVVFFRPVLLVSSGFRCWSSWSCRGWGVVGGVGLGSGLFFLRLLLYWPGPVWVWVGFCLESLILAQDERWRRA